MGVKRYYWLKLERKFFESLTYKVLAKKENGDSLIVLYMRLMTSSLEADGYIYLNNLCDSLEEQISIVYEVEIEDVQTLLDILKKANEIEVEDSCLHFVNLPVGSETPDAERMRKKRTKNGQVTNNVEQCSNNVQNCSKNVTTEIEKEKEIEIEIEKEIDKEIDKEREIEIDARASLSPSVRRDVSFLKKIYNEKCPSLQKVFELTDEDEAMVKQCLDKYSVDQLALVFDKAEKSDFLKGLTNTHSTWRADFYWLTRPENVEKVLRGQYDAFDRQIPRGSPKADELQGFYDMTKAWAHGEGG